MGIGMRRVGFIAVGGALALLMQWGCSGTVTEPLDPVFDPLPTEHDPATPSPDEQGRTASGSTGGGPNVGETHGDGGVAPCDQIAYAACARLAQCGPGLYPAMWEDDAHCLSAHARRCERISMAVGSSLGAGATACRDAITTASCADLATDAIDACSVPGTLPAGAACGHASQCQSGFCPLAAAGCGVCTDRVAPGGACVFGTCPSGLACNSAKLCVARAALGAACNGLAPCGATETCANGFCVPFGQLGAACEVAGFPKCDASLGLFCDPISNVCRTLVLAPPGQSCGVSVAGPVTTARSCTGAGQCVGATLAHPGTCAARRKEGESCDPSTTGCLAGLSCVAGACAYPNPGLCK